jgi:predicted ATP-grasp superfamily ATP-dependent carboligase
VPPLEESVTDFISGVGEICNRVGAAALLPNDHEGVTQIFASRPALGGAVVVAPTVAQYEAVCNKHGLTATAVRAGVDRPASVLLDASSADGLPLTLPCIVKPDTTDTEVNDEVVHHPAVMVETQPELHRAVENLIASTGTAMIEEFIVGRPWRVHFVAGETTFACVPVLTLRSYPRLVGMSTMQTVPARVPSALFDAARRLIQAIAYQGPGSVQFIEREGRFFVHDVNLRLPASVALSVRAGLDMPRLSVSLALGGEEIHDPPLRSATYLWLGGELRALRDDRTAGRPVLTQAVRLGATVLNAAVRPSYVIDFPRRGLSSTDSRNSGLSGAGASVAHGVIDPVRRVEGAGDLGGEDANSIAPVEHRAAKLAER